MWSDPVQQICKTACLLGCESVTTKLIYSRPKHAHLKTIVDWIIRQQI